MDLSIPRGHIKYTTRLLELKRIKVFMTSQLKYYL